MVLGFFCYNCLHSLSCDMLPCDMLHVSTLSGLVAAAGTAPWCASSLVQPAPCSIPGGRLRVRSALRLQRHRPKPSHLRPRCEYDSRCLQLTTCVALTLPIAPAPALGLALNQTLAPTLLLPSTDPSPDPGPPPLPLPQPFISSLIQFQSMPAGVRHRPLDLLAKAVRARNIAQDASVQVLHCLHPRV